MKHLSQKQHLEQTPVETEAAKIIKGTFVRLHSHRSLVPSISKYPSHLLVLSEYTSCVFLPVCRTGLVRNERTFPWNSYRPRRLRGSSLMYTQVMSLGTTFHGRPTVSTTGSWAHAGQPSATISQSVTQRNTWGPALFLPPPWGPLSHRYQGRFLACRNLAVLFHLWDEVASSHANALPHPWEILVALGKHHLPELLLERVLPRTAQLLSWSSDFWAA